MTVAILFARTDSIYKTIPDCDVYDIERNALNWKGGSTLVAHPPCRAWSRLSAFAKPLPGEPELAIWAVDQVRKFGGVLEHPAASKLWPACNLPPPGRCDNYGAFTLLLPQHWFGHRAEKQTLLYILGIHPSNVPPIPFSLTYPTHVVSCSTKKQNRLPEITKPEREHTPIAFARWLVQLASRCKT